MDTYHLLAMIVDESDGHQYLRWGLLKLIGMLNCERLKVDSLADAGL